MDKQPSCSTCDFMRRFGGAMRCLWNPPTPALVGAVPSKLAGAPPSLIIGGMRAEVAADEFCRHHPDLRGDIGELDRSPGFAAPEERAQIAEMRTDGGIILPPEATRQ